MARHERYPGARRWRPAALFGAVAALVLALALAAAPSGDGPSAGSTTPDGAGVRGDPAAPRGPSAPEVGWGFTHTQYSADHGETAAVSRARRLLSDPPLAQNQHLMGWGAGNPEPVPGQYDFADLDSRIGFVRSTGGTPVITLCCAPDWMKGGEPGADRTDWSRRALETAPLPEHFQDFADLAATVARRYPEVRHFLVWNEFKGFWDDARGRWDHEGYTRLYNLVYTALKEVDRDIRVGGPYLVMDSVDPDDHRAAPAPRGPWGALDRRVLDAFAYWNAHKKGADFVVVDGSSYTVDDDLRPDAFGATAKFTAVGKWVRERTGDLPLWWAEYYVEPDAPDAPDAPDGREWSERERLAVHAAALIALAESGATSGFYWNPQRRGADCPGCLWRSTRLADGGTPLPPHGLLSRFAREFPPGTRYRTVRVTGSGLRVLADDTAVLVVNTRDVPVTAGVDGRTVRLPGYGTTWLER
ncbi:xylan 1,4-beta-xylosidase [Streptomyces sp. JNUCC 64]